MGLLETVVTFFILFMIFGVGVCIGMAVAEATDDRMDERIRNALRMARTDVGKCGGDVDFKPIVDGEMEG